MKKKIVVTPKVDIPQRPVHIAVAGKLICGLDDAPWWMGSKEYDEQGPITSNYFFNFVMCDICELLYFAHKGMNDD